jgi:hypothetical protein
MMESILEYVSGSNLEVKLAFYMGLATLLVTVSLIIAISVLRVRLIMEEKGNDRFIAQWRPIIARAVAGEPIGGIILPPIGRRDRLMFLRLWNHYHEFLKGEASKNLNDMLRTTGMDAVARQWLSSRNRIKRFTAVMAVGRLGDKTCWEELKRLASYADPTLSLMAAGSMALMDAAGTPPIIVPLIVSREDWPANKVMDMLSKTDRTAISAPLIHAILNSEGKEVLRLVPFLSLVNQWLVWPVIMALLERSQDPEMISACLKIAGDPAVLGMARSYLDHPAWHVRAQAAAVLGRVGIEDDALRLIKMLSDKEWWVRYRAAHALTQMPSMKPANLKKLIQETTDKYAGDIVSHVMAEKKLA